MNPRKCIIKKNRTTNYDRNTMGHYSKRDPTQTCRHKHNKADLVLIA